jgi:hypothetical protein
VKSDWKRSEGKAGTFKHTAGKYSGDPDDKGFTSSAFTGSFLNIDADGLVASQMTTCLR